MALQYKNQSKVEAMSRKTGNPSYRMGDQMDILYPGRGMDYDELVYLRGQNGSAAGVDARRSDAWQKFGSANGANTTRADQTEREFGIRGTYP